MSVYAFNSLYSKLYNLEVDAESVERVKKNKCGDRMLVLRFTVGDWRLRDCLSVFSHLLTSTQSFSVPIQVSN